MLLLFLSGRLKGIFPGSHLHDPSIHTLEFSKSIPSSQSQRSQTNSKYIISCYRQNFQLQRVMKKEKDEIRKASSLLKILSSPQGEKQAHITFLIPSGNHHSFPGARKKENLLSRVPWDFLTSREQRPSAQGEQLGGSLKCPLSYMTA